MTIGRAPEGGAPPVDAGQINKRVEHALAYGFIPDEAEAAEAGRELRGCIARLQPEAEAAVDGLWRGSLEWFLRSGRLRVVRELQERGPERSCCPRTSMCGIYA